MSKQRSFGRTEVVRISLSKQASERLDALAQTMGMNGTTLAGVAVAEYVAACAYLIAPAREA